MRLQDTALEDEIAAYEEIRLVLKLEASFHRLEITYDRNIISNQKE